MYTPFFKFLIIFILLLIIYIIFNNVNEYFTLSACKNLHSPMATLEFRDNNNISLII